MNHNFKESQLNRQYGQIPDGVTKRIQKEYKKIKNSPHLQYQEFTPYFESEKELFAMCQKFFAYFPFLQEKQEKLKIFEKRTSFIKQEDSLKYRGLTERDLFGKPYFKLYYNCTIEDLIILNHEYAHGFYWQNFYTYVEQSFISELEGYFFEYLTFVFLKENKIITLDDEAKIESNNVWSIKEMYNKFIHGYNYINGIDHTLSNQYYLTVKNVNLEEEATYLYSYIIHSYLEKMAKRDLEKSFYYFERLKREKDRNEAKLILKNLKHYWLDQYYQ